MTLNIQCNSVHSGYDRQTCWVQARAGYVPDSQYSVLTAQKLRLTGSDIFYAIHSMYSEDGGQNWTELIEQKAFAPRYNDDGSYFYVSDFWPKWHAASNTMLGTGHAPLYQDDELCKSAWNRSPVYSTYNLDTHSWNQWEFASLPNEKLFKNCGAGSTQRVDLPNGDILLPVYGRDEKGGTELFGGTHFVVIVKFSFDGKTLTYKEHGNFMTVDVARGFVEPSLGLVDGKYFLTIRNDEKGYVACSDDGMNFSEPVPWAFDTGDEIGNYNTQQHWVTVANKLFLVYTRKGLNNDHIFRHRAPIVIARFDSEKLCLIRESEQVLVPERGARLGNFGVTEISDTEAWVVVSEWMQGIKGTEGDPAELEEHGSDNSIFIARING